MSELEVDKRAVGVKNVTLNGALTGEILNPERLTFSTIDFDDATLRLVAEAVGGMAS